MTRQEVHLVLNPAAGRGKAASCRGDVSRFLSSRGIHPVWHVSVAPGEAADIAAGLPEGSVVVAVGGDGTAREVASACVGTDKTLGVLPAGSGNDYVKALGVGTGMKTALETIAGGRARAVDAGEINGSIFINGVGIGFDAEVAAGVVKAPGWLGGSGRYAYSVLRLLAGFTCHEATLRLDGDRKIETKTILVAIALGTTYGARFRLAPQARLDDGLFDVVFSTEISRGEVLRLIPSALRGTFLRHPKAHLERAREVEVKMEYYVPAHADGELLDPTLTYRARVLPGALRVLCPS
ncbi:diacylglycerol/lipid kinase family protein [Rubrobacter calidifluminis]|uniref:diacylglycerol/lipid kinase family protein n=1 Tax=Rubrobacter calidifluminis TaxID=1392640 RepID=UPI0023602244|nr:diacylglycerol kinase family protein [Rubrobacter calidifluminis]